MRMKLVLTAVVAAGVAAHGFAQVTQPQAQPAPRPLSPVAARHPALQQLLDSYVAQDKMSGVVVAIGREAGPPAIIAAGRIGEPGSARADGDTLWRVYSMTKPITGMAAMMLIEDGKLRLDQPISEILPAFKTMRVIDGPDTLASHPANTPITVRNLLTHTAGLGYTIVTRGPLLKEYERLGLIPFQGLVGTEDEARKTRPATLQGFADAVAKAPLIAEPGTKWSYSIGLDVLGAVIEEASGMPFDAFVQTRLFDPLGMTSSYWTVPASDAGRLADNYIWLGNRRVVAEPGKTSTYLRKPSFPYGGAGLVMSARDYDRFLAMLLNGGQFDGKRVMKPETVRLGMSNLLPPGVSFNEGGDAQGPTQGYGAGGSVYLRDIPGGASKGTYGWSGAAGTFAWVDPVRKVRQTVMVNYFPSDKWPLRADVVKALYADAQR